MTTESVSEQRDTTYLDTMFDHIYVLNLDRRGDRWKNTKSRLANLVFDFSNNVTRFSATDGQDSGVLEAWRRLPYFLPNSGVLAVLFSIQRILIDARQKGWKRFLLLEDDVLFHLDFKQKWAQCQTQIPAKWKLLFLGNSMHSWRYKERCHYYSGFLTTKGSIPGAFAVGIDRSAIDDLWYGILHGKSPWDLAPLKYVNQKYPGQCILLYPQLCIAEVEDSNLRSRSMITKAKDCQWNLANFYPQ